MLYLYYYGEYQYTNYANIDSCNLTSPDWRWRHQSTL